MSFKPPSSALLCLSLRCLSILPTQQAELCGPPSLDPWSCHPWIPPPDSQDQPHLFPTWSHPGVLSTTPPGTHRHAPNVVSFVFNLSAFFSSCTMPWPGDATADKGNHGILPLRSWQAHLQTSWLMFSVSGMTTLHHPPASPTAAWSSLPILSGSVLYVFSILKLVLRTSGQKSSLLMLTSPCCASFFFFLAL